MVADLPLTGFRVQDDSSFGSLYDSLTRVLLSATSSTFQLASLPDPSPRLRNQFIRLLVRKGRRVGRLIFALKPVSLLIVVTNDRIVSVLQRVWPARTRPPNGALCESL